MYTVRLIVGDATILGGGAYVYNWEVSNPDIVEIENWNGKIPGNPQYGGIRVWGRKVGTTIVTYTYLELDNSNRTKSWEIVCHMHADD